MLASIRKAEIDSRPSVIVRESELAAVRRILEDMGLLPDDAFRIEPVEGGYILRLRK